MIDKRFYFPGDSLAPFIEANYSATLDEHGESQGPNLKIGSGILVKMDLPGGAEEEEGRGTEQESLVVVKPGLLSYHKGKKQTSKVSILTRGGKYLPVTNDVVIGVIVARHAEAFSVNIGAPRLANLSIYAFEGATKRNRPNLNIGHIVYAKTVLANKDLDPELSCISHYQQGLSSTLSQSTRKTVEGYGELKNGHVRRISYHFSSYLIKPTCALLEQLGQLATFDIVVGNNGLFWLSSVSLKQTLYLSNVIASLDTPEKYLKNGLEVDETLIKQTLSHAQHSFHFK